ncbi:MAG: ELWxxDGT repeat protein [Bacteroidia bacterium]
MKSTLTSLLLILLFFNLQAQNLFLDIRPGSSTSAVDHFTVMPSGVMMFMASNGISGVELWQSDGTIGGTNLIKDIYPGSNPSYPLAYHEYNGEIFFRASNGTNGYEFWKTDGTSGGTQMVYDAWTGASNGVSLVTNGFVIAEAGGLMVMSLSNGTTNNGQELYASDGTTAGTVMLKDIYVGTGSSGPQDFVSLGAGAVFTAYEYDINTATGSARELWRTNGTAAGTILLKDINPGIGSSTPQDLYKVGNTIFFSADDGTNGRELWKTDGTTAGTVLVKDINPTGSSSPEAFERVGSYLMFFADDGVHGDELWRTDGTTAGTVMVKDINPGSADSKYIIPYHTEMDGYYYFNGNDGVNGTEIWRSDGTEAGTNLVIDIRTGQYGSNPNGFFSHDGLLYVSAYDITDGFELWISDGVTTGKYMSFQAGLSCGCPSDFTFFNNLIFFTADNGFSGREMWSLDPSTITSLPVELLDFQANLQANGQVLLEWSTATEINNDYFVIERSVDGVLYEPIAQIDGNGTKASQSDYDVLDNKPLNGKNIYRIKQVDFDGQVHYSSMVVVNASGQQGFSLSPNPASDQLRVEFPLSERSTSISLFNMAGQQLRAEQIMSGQTFLTLPLSDLSAGVYLIEVNQSGIIIREKFIKQ